MRLICVAKFVIRISSANLLYSPHFVSCSHVVLINDSAYWRQAGMTYLDYLSVSSKAVRNSLKEPAKTKAASRGSFFYNKTTAAAPEKVPVTNATA